VRLRRSDPHTLAGAYALDALASADRAAFERHLAACDDCRQEVAGLTAAAARLGQAAAATPPERLREQVLAMAARTRQLPPVGRREPAERAAAGPAGRATGRHGDWQASHGQGQGWRGLAVRGFAGRGLAWTAAPRLAVAVAGLCLLMALGVGGLMLHTQHRLTQEQARNAGIAAVLSAPDATMMTMHADGGRATLVMSHKERALVLTTARLPGLPTSERYEVWLMGPRGARPAGMLPQPHRGMTPPLVVAGLAAGDRVGVTVEPSGGSRHPTTEPVLMVVLPS
jgi:anti-sigma-K factor RskA